MSLTLNEARERISRTIEEYIQLDSELRALENTNYRVCIFGSARIKPQDPVYHTVFHLAQSLSETGIDVVTGGGPGLMEAANRGVLASKRHRGKSYGLPLDLPTLVERPNRHLDIKSAHKRFSSRLDEFIRLSHAVVVAPGGIGTLLEFMYVWQLVQLQILDRRPVILLDRRFWSGFLAWMAEMPAEQRLINPEDLDAVTMVDTVEEAMSVIEASHQRFQAEQEAREQGELGADVLDAQERLTQAALEVEQDLASQVRFTEVTLEEVEGRQAAA